MRPFNYGKNECTPCKGKLKMRGSPSLIGKVYKFIRQDNSVYASSRCSDSKTFRSHLKKQTKKQTNWYFEKNRHCETFKTAAKT